MKKENYFFIYFFSIILFISCSNKEKESSNLDKERLNAETLIASDVRLLTNKALDNISLGFGSIILNAALTTNEQDSILLSPFIPLLEKELKTQNEEDLKAINSDKMKRFKFTAMALIKNKELIKQKASEKFKGAGTLIDKVIVMMQSYSETK